MIVVTIDFAAYVYVSVILGGVVVRGAAEKWSF
jgi:hypothetical protein